MWNPQVCPKAPHLSHHMPCPIYPSQHSQRGAVQTDQSCIQKCQVLGHTKFRGLIMISVLGAMMESPSGYLPVTSVWPPRSSSCAPATCCPTCPRWQSWLADTTRASPTWPSLPTTSCTSSSPATSSSTQQATSSTGRPTSSFSVMWGGEGCAHNA